MRASTSSVAANPSLRPRAQISPTSRPTFSGLLTPTPTSSNMGCLTISAITILPTNPVPHTTMRLVSESFTAFTIGGLTIIGDQLRQSLDLLSEFLDLSPGRRLIAGVFLGDALHDPRSQRRSHDTDQTDTADHQRDGAHAPPASDWREVAVTDGGDGRDRPPERIAERRDVGARNVPLDVQDRQRRCIDHDDSAEDRGDDDPAADGVAHRQLKH